MALYDRLAGTSDAVPKIPVHSFVAILAEFARGRMTGAQAQAAINAVSGEPLSASEVTQAQALLATVVGSATAKLARAKEIDDVLLLAESRVPGYSAAEIVVRLGV